MILRSFSVPPLGCNCSILGDPVTKQALVVDPGGDAERILEDLRGLGLTVSRIVHTHAHFDHFLASGEMQKATGAPLCLHRDDRELWENLELQCRIFGVPYVPVPPPNEWLNDEEPLSLGDIQGIALHTPGHTPGSMCYHFPVAKLLLAGDTLFLQLQVFVVSKSAGWIVERALYDGSWLSTRNALARSLIRNMEQGRGCDIRMVGVLGS